mgnify:CR=1 FL=1
MERLTEENQIGPFASLKDKAEAVSGAFGTYECLYAHMVAVTRLKEYEDAMPLERAAGGTAVQRPADPGRAAGDGRGAGVGGFPEMPRGKRMDAYFRR